MGQGTFLLSLEIMLLTLALVKFADKYLKNNKIVIELKKKLIWSSVFRG